MSCQPIGLSGHPSASAIGRGIAMVSGDCIRLGSDAGIRSERSTPTRWTRRISTQLVAAGDQTSGRGPSVDSFHPRARASSASPDALRTIFTAMHWPSTLGPVFAKSAAISPSRPDFSFDAVTTSGALVLQVVAPGGVGGRPIKYPATRSAPTRSVILVLALPRCDICVTSIAQQGDARKPPPASVKGPSRCLDQYLRRS